MRKSPVAGLRMFSSARAVSEIQARSTTLFTVGLQLGFRNRRENRWIQLTKCRPEVFFRSRTTNQLQRSGKNGDTAGGAYEARVRLRVLVAAKEEEPILDE